MDRELPAIYDSTKLGMSRQSGSIKQIAAKESNLGTPETQTDGQSRPSPSKLGDWVQAK